MFHVQRDGVTGAAVRYTLPVTEPLHANPFAAGLLIGLLIGEGHFGGDGRQPHLVLRMHARHEALFHWLLDAVPGSRLYGPYHHGGRHYYQWMARGPALRALLPILDTIPWRDIDPPTWERYQAMKRTYRLERGSGTGS